MSAPAIDVRGLHKTYRRRRGKPPERALDGLDLVVEPGGVHGFLGPNGSGKTTTIRVLLGLVAADGGAASVLGARVPDGLAGVVERVGAIVEAPQLFPSFTGRRNLEVLAPLGPVPPARVDEVLDLVGLTDRADDRVKGYSLGMRQRLAIAAALMKRPTLLVLDEPTNGLDPAGMVEVRELIRQLGATDGPAGPTTVLLSSHLLAEVQQVCDHVTIVNHGRTVAAGPVEDVLAQAGVAGDVRVVVADPAAGAAALAAAGYRVEPQGLALVVRGADDPARVNWALASAGQWARELTPLGVDLEQAFLTLTQEPPAGAAGESQP